jgi:hypothetical protein
MLVEIYLNNILQMLDSLYMKFYTASIELKFFILIHIN